MKGEEEKTMMLVQKLHDNFILNVSLLNLLEGKKKKKKKRRKKILLFVFFGFGVKIEINVPPNIQVLYFAQTVLFL
jgi:hypothetical protein